MFAYCSGLALDRGYRSLIAVIVSSQFAVCTLMTLMHVADSGLAGTLQSSSMLQPGIPFLVLLSQSVIEPVHAIGVCPIVVDTCIDMATLLMAWSAINCVEWAAVSIVSASQLLSIVIQTCKVAVFSGRSSARVVQSGKNVVVPHSQLLEVLFSKPMLSWSRMHRQVDQYMHRQDNVFIPSSVPGFRAFGPHMLTAYPSTAGMWSAESSIVAASLYPASDASISETRLYHAVCASLLPVLMTPNRAHGPYIIGFNKLRDHIVLVG